MLGQKPYLARFSVVFVALVALIGCDRKLDLPADSTASLTLPSDDQVRDLLDDIIDFTYLHRRLNLRDHAAWQIVHGALAYEHDFMVEDNDGKLVPVLEYLLNGGEMNGWTLRPGVKLSDERRGLRAVVEGGSLTGQGHSDQWLGYLADCNLQPDQPINVGGQTFTIEDMILQTEYDVPTNPIREYSWTLMALTTYRNTDYEWTASDGKTWNIGQLLDIEVEHDLDGSACGGSHRMCGIAMALNRHVAQGGKLEGPWQAADEKVKRCVMTARKFQNPDGSFSSNYFQRPGISPDVKVSIGTTGHTLEFVVLASTDEELKELWIRRAAVQLCKLLQATKNTNLECGALYHAMHGLILYRERTFGPHPFPREQLIAKGGAASPADGAKEKAAAASDLPRSGN